MCTFGGVETAMSKIPVQIHLTNTEHRTLIYSIWGKIFHNTNLEHYRASQHTKPKNQ